MRGHVLGPRCIAPAAPAIVTALTFAFFKMNEFDENLALRTKHINDAKSFSLGNTDNQLEISAKMRIIRFYSSSSP